MKKETFNIKESLPLDYIAESEPAKTEDSFDILLEILEKSTSSRFQFSRDKVLQQEARIEKVSKYEKTLKRVLERYGIEDIGIKKVGKNIFSIPIQKTEIKNLPKAYGYKGGYARMVLEKELGLASNTKARDVDIVRTSNLEIEEGMDAKLSEKYMADDFEHGYGIEELEKEYFESRDFTLNEVLVANNNIYLTKECLLDTIRGVVRFSDYEKQEGVEGKYSVKGKLMAKAVRLSVGMLGRKPRSLVDGEPYKYLDINDFHIALHLDRALQEGEEIARRYVQKLVKLGQLEGDQNHPDAVMRRFINRASESGSFVFRYAPESMLEDEKNYFDDYLKTLEEDAVDSAQEKYGSYEDGAV